MPATRAREHICYNHSMETSLPSAEADTPAPERPRDSGVDVTLLIANLRLTPTERVQRAQQMLDEVLALQREARRWREHSGDRVS